MFSIPLPDPFSELLPSKDKMKIKTDKQKNQNKIKKYHPPPNKRKHGVHFVLVNYNSRPLTSVSVVF